MGYTGWSTCAVVFGRDSWPDLPCLKPPVSSSVVRTVEIHPQHVDEPLVDLRNVPASPISV